MKCDHGHKTRMESVPTGDFSYRHLKFAKLMNKDYFIMIEKGECYFFSLLVIITIIFIKIQSAEGACTCAVFQENATKPIIEHTLQYNVTCDKEGLFKCQQLCIALAHAASDKAPDMICEKLNQHIENLIVSVFTKVCTEDPWMFTGLKNTVPTCCHEKKAFNCSKTSPYN